MKTRTHAFSKRFLFALLAASLVFCLAPSQARAAVGDLPWWWWNYDYGYQLRDVSGFKDGHTIAGAQWFATVFERWLWRWRFPDDDQVLSFQMTQGGQAPSVPVVTSADLVTGFDHVYLEDPRHHYPPFFRDPWFDPIESMYLVIPSGRGDLRLLFGNDVGRRTAWRDGPWGPYMPPLVSIDVMEDILISVPGYSVQPYPKHMELVSPDRWLDRTFRFMAEDPQEHGSSLGYLTFRQSASYDVPDKGYRESIKIPLVVANVFDGPASEPGHELYFDMTVFGTVWSKDVGGERWVTDLNNPVTRRKFRWGVGENLAQDFGTFFMIHPYGGGTPVYKLKTRVTNRTGTRYRAQRYDNLGTLASRDLLPLYWAYDVTPDLYKTLPERFYLDKQSQIAPGLVTHYESELDTLYSSSESLRLYPFASPEKPHDLRLTYRRIGGMMSFGVVSAPLVGGRLSPWTVQGFHMTYVDVMNNPDNTEREIAALVGGEPVTPDGGFGLTGVATQYIKADAINSFEINSAVPAGLVPVEPVEVVSKDVASKDVASKDVKPQEPEKVALLPLQVRLRIPRQENLLVGRWEELDRADDPLSVFMKYGAIWVRSVHTNERDMNLLTSLGARGSDPKAHVRAFTYNDALYLDFIAFLADAKSRREGKTAFLDVFKDDGVPYILLGDGKRDGAWNLSFYVAATGPNPTPGEPIPPKPQPSPNEGKGGGCDAGLAELGVFLLAGLFLPRGRGKAGRAIGKER